MDGPTHTLARTRGLALLVLSDRGISTATGVSQWNDQSGNSRHLPQAAGGSQMAYTLGGRNRTADIVADGSNDFFSPVSFTLNQPFMVFLGLKVNTLTAAGGKDCIWDGFTAGSTVASVDTSPKTDVFAGADFSTTEQIGSGNFDLLEVLYNGASSYLKRGPYGVLKASGNPGANNAGGFTLGALATGARSVGASYKACLITSVVLNEQECKKVRKLLRAYMASQG